jgi:SAM-dependent methyltransferase
LDVKRVAAAVRFWGKTALYRLTPGGFGYYRRLHRYRNPDYDHARDMHSVRRRHNGSTGWGATDDQGLRTRRYESYDEYVAHQREKLEEILKIDGGFSNAVIARYRLKFYRRFRHIVRLLPPSAEILCLGARLGTEVEVLRDLGFANASGIDLNPGPDNALVRVGDFQHLGVPDSSVDLVYSNCLDHAFDLAAFFEEQARVLKPGGYALYDFPHKNDEGSAPFEAVVWDSDAPILAMMSRFGEVVHRETEEDWQWFLLRRPDAE